MGRSPLPLEFLLVLPYRRAQPRGFRGGLKKKIRPNIQNFAFFPLLLNFIRLRAITLFAEEFNIPRCIAPSLGKRDNVVVLEIFSTFAS